MKPQQLIIMLCRVVEVFAQARVDTVALPLMLLSFGKETFVIVGQTISNVRLDGVWAALALIYVRKLVHLAQKLCVAIVTRSHVSTMVEDTVEAMMHV